MVRKTGSRSRHRQGQFTSSTCANCSIDCPNQLLFTDTLPEWIHRSKAQAREEFPSASDRIRKAQGAPAGETPVNSDVSRPSRIIRPPKWRESDTSESRRKTRKVLKNEDAVIVTVFDALLTVFDLHWKRDKVLLESTKAKKGNLRLCSSCASCLSQVYDGLLRFKTFSTNAISKSFLHPIVFPEQSTTSTQTTDHIEYVPHSDGNFESTFTLSDGQSAFPQCHLNIKYEDKSPVFDQDFHDTAEIKIEPADPEQKISSKEVVEAPPKRIRKRKKGISSSRSAFRLHGGQGKRIRKNDDSTHYICTEGGCYFEADYKIEYVEHLSSVHGVNNEQDEVLVPIISRSDFHSCVVCSNTFVSKEELDSHCSSKHVPSIRLRTYECTICSKTFFNNHNLKDHQSTHVPTPPFACSKCSFKAKRHQELNRHMRLVHLQEKNFFCRDCGKGYTLKWQLTNHEKLHNEAKNYPCTEGGCEKAFRTRANLRQHLQLHRGCKYVCDICGQSYTRNSYLRLHMNGAHLMLPLPPSYKKQKPKENTTKTPRPKSSNKREANNIIIVDNCVTIQESNADTEIVPSNDEDESAAEEDPTESREEILGLGYTDPENPEAVTDVAESEREAEHNFQAELGVAPEDATLEKGDCDTGAITSIETPTFALSSAHQVVCYPMGMNIISTEGVNTYYITTAAPPQDLGQVNEEPKSTPLTVYGSFTDFLPSQP